RSKVEGAGLPFRAFEQTPDYDANVPISPEDFAPFLFDHIFFEPLMAADLEIELRREPADAVIVDCMLTTPLVPLEARQLPSAVLVHTLYRFWEGWKLDEMPGFPRLAALRASHGLPPVATLEDGWR